jgi:hypothetical protein
MAIQALDPRGEGFTAIGTKRIDGLNKALLVRYIYPYLDTVASMIG